MPSTNENILYFIQKSAEFLKKKSIPSPRLEAEVLLSNVLGIPRIQLYAKFDMPLAETEKETYRDWIKKRADHTPTAYILKQKNFYGYEFYVDENVLIPRPETEELVEYALKFMESKPVNPDPIQILDLCSGSGCIGISFAKEFQKRIHFKDNKISVSFSDISPKALEISKKNANVILNSYTETHSKQIKLETESESVVSPASHTYKIPDLCFYESNLFQSIPEDRKFDLILTNPPYVLKEEYNELEPEVKKEPEIALVVKDFSEFHRELLTTAHLRLNPKGVLIVETNPNKIQDLRQIGEEIGYSTEIIQDISKRDHFLLLHKTNSR